MLKENSSLFLKPCVYYPINQCFLHLLFSCGISMNQIIISSELYRNGICVSEDVAGDDSTGHVRKSSFNSKLRKGSTCNVVDDALAVDCPGMIH